MLCSTLCLSTVILNSLTYITPIQPWLRYKLPCHYIAIVIVLKREKDFYLSWDSLLDSAGSGNLSTWKWSWGIRYTIHHYTRRYDTPTSIRCSSFSLISSSGCECRWQICKGQIINLNYHASLQRNAPQGPFLPKYAMSDLIFCCNITVTPWQQRWNA
jgi:hypothetical protein